MILVRLIVAAELRRSWRQLAGIAAVAALGVGVIMVTLAGARRADTSFERFRASVVDGHVFVGVDEAPDRVGELADLSTVEAFAPFGYVPIVPRDASDEDRLEGGGFASIDGTWLYEVQRPRVLSGRMPSAGDADQMVVNEVFAQRFGVTPGDVLPMEAASTEAMAGTGDPDGVAMVDLEVAGVVRTPLDIGVNTGGPIVYLPPGFLEAHPEVGIVRGFGLVRLVGGDAAFAGFQRQAHTVLDDEPSFTAGLVTAEGRTVQRALDVQSTALVIVALVAAAATAALLAQVSSRRIRGASSSSAALRSLGATRGQRAAILAGPPVVAAGVGVLAAAAISVLLSATLPRGLARVTEPHPGAYADAVVLAGGGAVIALLMATIMGLVAARAVRRDSEHIRDAPRQRARGVGRIQRAGAPISVVTGLRLALPSYGGPERSAGLTSMLGLVAGGAGLIAVIAFGVKFDSTVNDQGAWGAPFDLLAELNLPGSGQPVRADASNIPGVETVTRVQYGEALALGDVTVAVFGVHADKGELAVTAVEGRVPTGDGEALLGPATADALGIEVGDTLAAPTPQGPPIHLTVVGLALVPILGDGHYDEGVVVLADTFQRLTHDDAEWSLWVGLADRANANAVASALRETGAAVGRIEPPSEQRNLRSTLAYPVVVGGLVALLALAGLANAMAAGGAGRRVELATLRALGLTGRQVRTSVVWQSTAIAVIGLGLAIPLGFVSAGAAWAAGADSLSLDPSLATPWPAAAMVSLGLLGAAAATAAPLGRRWARRSITADLRCE